MSWNEFFDLVNDSAIIESVNITGGFFLKDTISWGHRFISRDLQLCKQDPNISLFALRSYWNNYEPNAGSGITVYLIDSGVRRSHIEFDNNIFTLNEFEPNGSDEIGHGTAIASLISGSNLGSAPKAKICSLKVFGNKKTSTQELVIQALQTVLENHQANLKNGLKERSIVNLSLATSPTKELLSITEQLALLNILVVIASDNGGRENFVFDLDSCDSVVTVGGIDENSGPLNSFKSDIYAPGKSIQVAVASSDSDYKVLTGTSMAAGFVTGVAAAMWSKVIEFSAKELKEHLLKTSHNVNGFAVLIRSNEDFAPKWNAGESGLIESYKPNQEVFRKLRCKNPAKGDLRFKIIQGFLPNGLSVSEDGIISGQVSLDKNVKLAHLNYFSTVIRAENNHSFTDRNISIIVTENFNKIRHDNSIITAVQLAKCDGINGTYAMNLADNQSAPGVDDVNSATPDANVYLTSGDCCFTADSLVRMHDGKQKFISEVSTHDLVLQNGNSASVLAAIALPIKLNRKVYQINTLPIYLTDEHPVVGKNGLIYAIAPEQNGISTVAHRLQIGVILAGYSGEIEVTQITEVSCDNAQLIYHLYVDGDGSYLVGDILTHRKHEGILSKYLNSDTLNRESTLNWEYV